jgi:tetratricopeptide (TPR) repeat protein
MNRFTPAQLRRSDRHSHRGTSQRVMFRVTAPVVLLVCLCGSALADTQSDAAEHFKRGQAADLAGRYKDAIAEYEQAYKLVPHVDVLYNIAVDYEKLEQWSSAADYFQRYLDERDTPAADVVAVNKRIRGLRAKVKPAVVEPPPPPETHEPEKPPVVGNGFGTVVVAPPPPVARWHAGASYGLGFGDAPTERYIVHGGIQMLNVLEADAVLGSFGKNDRGLGVLTRIVFMRGKRVSPFARASLTIGYAKQDASSTAETRFPFGFEAGGGLQVGAHGWLELGLALRWVRGGWDAASTTADSFVNDDFAVAIDLGFSFDSGLATALQTSR